MNKKFRRLTNTVLALVLSLGMVFGLIPTTSLMANAAQVTEQVATVSGVEIETGYDGWKTDNTEAGGKGLLSYNGAAKLRARAKISDYTYAAGDVITINYESKVSGVDVLICNTNNIYDKIGTLSKDKTSLTYTLPESSTFNDEVLPNYFRFQGNIGSADDTLEFKGITITRQKEVPDEPADPEPVVTGPSIEYDWSDFECTPKDDGSRDYRYKTLTWGKIFINVKDCDVTKYDKVLIDITPYDGMRLGVYNQDEASIISHENDECVVKGGRQTISVPLKENITQLRLFCDAPSGAATSAGVPDEYRTFTIHSIKFAAVGSVDPVNPEDPDDRKPSVSVNLGETSSAYDPKAQPDGSVKFTYNHDAATIAANGGWWHTVALDVKNCDITKYNQLRVDITPAGDDMTLGFYDKAGNSIKGHSTLPKSGRQVVKVDLTANLDQIKIYCDANLAALGNREFTIHKVWLCKADDPDFLLLDKATFTTVTIGDNCGTVVEDRGGASATVTPGADKTKIFANFTDYTYKAGDVFVIASDKINWSGAEQVLIGYGLSGGQYVDLRNPQTAGDLTYYVLPETANFEATQPILIRYKGNPNSTGENVELKGAHIYDGEQFAEYLKSLETEKPEETRYAKINRAASSGYTFVDNADGSVTVKYQREAKANWGHINVDIVNDDYDAYDQVRIELTPARAMTMAITANKKDAEGHDIWFRSHADFDPEDKQILKINLKKDNKAQAVEMPLTGLYLYCDSEEAHNIQLVGDAGKLDREFTIDRIWLCNSTDPDFMPTEKATFTNVRGNYCDVSDVKEGGFATVTSKGSEKDGKIRLYGDFTYNEGFSYNAGDVFALKWDGLDYDTIKEFEAIIGFEDGSAGHIAFASAKQAGDYVYYELPADKDGKFATTQPKYVRFKANVGPDGSVSKTQGMHIYDGAEWKRFINSFSYNEEDCPQGVAVSYYTDIYSRGFAWATYDNIDNEQELQYIKVTEGMTKEDVDWESAEVEHKTATKGEDRTDVSGNVWHMYKVHLENREPGSYWYFRVGNKDTGFSDVGSFKIEEAKTDKLTFMHLTDCQEGNQSGYTRWAKVLECAYKMYPESKFVAFTGDLTNDSHAHLNMMQWNWGLGEPKKNLLNTVIMPSAGNHDEWPYSFTDRFDIKWADYIKAGDKHPDTGKVITDGTIDEKTGGCYTFEYGDDIIFINLNTNDTNNEIDFTSQLNWLKKQLETYKDKKWKIVQLHKGLMSTGNHTNDGEVDWLRDILPPLFAEYKVDLVLQGHDHVYTRSRSYFYGKDFNGKNYSGHQPCWLNGVVYDGRDEDHPKYVFQGKERDITNLEPNGTHYVTINYCANKSYAVAPYLDKVIYPGVNPIFSIGSDGKEHRNGTSIQLQGQPMFGAIQIDGDTLIYDSYVYNTTTKDATLYDTFMVKKGDKTADSTGLWNRGYRDAHEGFSEAVIENIMVEDKEYDGKPVKLNLHGFVTSEPTFIDYSKLTFHTTGTTADGKAFDSTTELPAERGTYKMTISADSVTETDGDPIMYYTLKEINFTIE